MSEYDEQKSPGRRSTKDLVKTFSPATYMAIFVFARLLDF
jgi:hypothetical protein